MPENRETGEKWSFARSAQRLLLLTLTCRSAIILTNRVTQTIMIDSLSNGVHKSTHRSTVDPSWPNPCRQRSDLDGRVTSQLLRPDVLITNGYEITPARTPRVNRKLSNVSHSRIMQPQYLPKVNQIRPSTSQDAPPFATTTSACMHTNFVYCKCI